MSTHSPSPKPTTQRRRRDGLFWLVLLALLLAVLPVGCVAELALRLVVPANEPFKDVGSSSSLGAYAPFPGGISYAAVDPDAPNLRSTEVARRERNTPVALPGAVTVAAVAEVGPPVAQIVPPTPTLGVPATPRPTVTPGPPATGVAGGGFGTPTPTEVVLIPGVTATPAPSNTSTSSPTSTPTRAPGQDPSPTTGLIRTPIAPIPSPTPPVVGSPTAATATAAPPSATAAPPTLAPTLRPSPSVTPTDPGVQPTPSETAPVVPTPTAATPIAPTPSETAPIVPTPTDALPSPTATIEPPTPTDTPPPPTPTDTPPPPTPELSIGAAQITEGNLGETRQLSFTVSLSSPAPGTVTVSYATVAGGGAAPATSGADYTPVSGLLTFTTGQQQQAVVVPIIGDAITENDETFGVQLANPSGASIAVGSATGTIIDDDLPTVSFASPSSRQVQEGNDPGGGNPDLTDVTFTVQLSGTLERAVTVSYNTVDLTAVSTSPGADFVARSGSVTFVPGGPLSQPVTVTIIGDNTPEPNEQFRIDLRSGPGHILGTPNRATVTILNDDLPTLSIDDPPAIQEGDSGQTDVVFTVTRVGASSQPISVTYTTQDNTATAPADYVATTGTLVFGTSDTSLTISVPVNGDTVDEADETFFVNLSNPINAVIGDGQGRATILDDDPRVSLDTPGPVVDEGQIGTGGTLVFTVRLSQVSARDVVVNYAVTGLTATSGVDFIPPAVQTLTIPAGQLTGQVVVPIVGDIDLETDETLEVRLTSVVEGAVGSPDRATGTIRNDDFVNASLSLSQTTVVEGNAPATTAVNATVTLNRAPGTGATVSVRVRTVGGTATSGVDFTALNQVLTFTGVQTTTQVSFNVIGDALIEGDEQLTVELVNDQTPLWIILSPPVAQTVTIDDDDFATVTITNASLIEGNAGQTNMAFTVAISPIPVVPVSIDWATQGTGSATPDVDFISGSGAVVLGTVGGVPVASQQVNVPIVGDLLIEGDETFQVALSGGTPPVVILPGPATGTIINDDAVGLVISKAGSSPAAWLPGPPVSDDARWTITVVNNTAAAVNLAISDDLAGLAYPVIAYGTPSIAFGGTGGTGPQPSLAGSTVTWSGTLNAGGSLDLVVSAIVNLGTVTPPPCDTTTLVNPSYQITVNGLTYAPTTSTAPAPVGDCVLPLVAAPLSLVREREAEAPEPTATATATATRTPTAAPTATLSPTAEPTDTREPTRTPTVEPTETAEPTATPIETAEPTAIRIPTRTPTEEPTETPRPTRTPTAEPTDTREPTRTATAEPTDTPEPTDTREPMRTPTAEPTDTREPTQTRTATAEPTDTREPTRTATAEPTDTREPTQTRTPTAEPTDTREPTRTATAEPTDTREPTAEPTETREPTAEPTEVREPTAEPTEEPKPIATTTLVPTIKPVTTKEPGQSYPAPVDQPKVQPPAQGTTSSVSSMGLGGGSLLSYGLIAVLILALLRRRS